MCAVHVHVCLAVRAARACSMVDLGLALHLGAHQQFARRAPQVVAALAPVQPGTPHICDASLMLYTEAHASTATKPTGLWGMLPSCYSQIMFIGLIGSLGSLCRC